MIVINEPRCCSTDVLHKIWDSIESIVNNGGNKVPCPADVLNELETKHNIGRGVAESELFFAVADHLVGLERDEEGDMMNLRLPEYEGPVEKPRHEWYCFHCHLGKKPLQGCSCCHRVYHPRCADTYSAIKSWSKRECPACVAVYESKRPDKMSVAKLNALANLTVERVRDKNFSVLNCSHRDIWTVAAGRKVINNWRHDWIVWKPIDLEEIRTKTLNEYYRTLEHFNLDCETVLHNLVIYFGSNGLLENKMASGAFAVLRNTLLHAIEEVRICCDCYERSLSKRSSLSFTIPCTNSHKVIWMRTETGLFWPAKVMRKDGNRFDVILFGGNHPRVWVVEEDTVDEMASQSSSEPGFREALQELHQFLNVSSNQSIYELGDSVKINICESNTNRRPKPLKNVRKKLPRKVPIIKQQMDAHSSSAEDEWEVEQILATKCVNGLRYYWISWKGYPESQNTWEPADNLNCPNLVQAFLESQDKSCKNTNKATKKPKSAKNKIAVNVKSNPFKSSNSNEEYWEVEQVLDCKVEKNVKYYLISWKGFTSEENSWEKESSLHCDELIEEFDSRSRKPVKKLLGRYHDKLNCQKINAAARVSIVQSNMSRKTRNSKAVMITEKVSNDVRLFVPTVSVSGEMETNTNQHFDHAEIHSNGPKALQRISSVGSVRKFTRMSNCPDDINPCVNLIDESLELTMSNENVNVYSKLTRHKRRLATEGTIQAFKSPRVERKSENDESQVNSDGELEEKIKKLFGGPFYDEGKVSFLCLACCCEFSSDETVKIHIVNEHESFL